MGLEDRLEDRKERNDSHVLEIPVVQEKSNRNTAVELPIADGDWILQNICSLLPLGGLIIHYQLLASNFVLRLALDN